MYLSKNGESKVKQSKLIDMYKIQNIKVGQKIAYVVDRLMKQQSYRDSCTWGERIVEDGELVRRDY